MILDEIQDAINKIQAHEYNYRAEGFIIAFSPLTENKLINTLISDPLNQSNIDIKFAPTQEARLGWLFGIPVNNKWPYNDEIIVYHTTACYNPDLLVKIIFK